MKSAQVPVAFLSAAAVVFFVAVITVAHLFAPSAYSFTQNTVSDLGAQGYSLAWIMRSGLMGFGLLISAAMAVSLVKQTGSPLPDALLLVYGLGIFFAGVFSTLPFEPGISYSARESSLHSFFATAAGIAISFSMVSHVFMEKGSRHVLFHALAALFVIGLSALFGLAEGGAVSVGKGLVQKVMYAGGLTWIVVNYAYFRLRTPAAGITRS